MKKILLLLLILIYSDVYSQIEYQIPRTKNDLESFQYDFKQLERKSSKKEKTELLKEMIVQVDTSSCYYFTGYDSYHEFTTKLNDFADSLPSELENNIHLVKLNDDDEYDFIYDRLNLQWDSQSIYSMIKKPQGWRMQKIPGFIVVNIRKEKNNRIEYDTYQWACCDYPYNFYYVVKQQKDSILIKSKTAFPTYTKLPKKIAIDTIKKIEMKTNYLKVYSLNDTKTKEVYATKSKVEIEFISETKNIDQKLIFVRLKINEEEEQPFNYFLGWVKKEDINYIE